MPEGATSGEEDRQLRTLLTLPVLLLMALLFGGQLRFRNEPTVNVPEQSEALPGADVDAIPAGRGIYSVRSLLWNDPLKAVRQASEKLPELESTAPLPEVTSERSSALSLEILGMRWELPATDVTTDSQPAREASPSRGARFQKLLMSVDPRPSLRPDADPASPSYIDPSQSRSGLLLMPVLVPGGYQSDRIRQRVETREAVVQSLMSQGYRLDYPDRLSFMRLPFILGLGAERTRRASLVVPFKLYTYRPGTQDEGVETWNGYQKVLVFWIDQEQLGNDPLTALAQLLTVAFLDQNGIANNLEEVFGAAIPSSNQDDENCQDSHHWIRKNAYHLPLLRWLKNRVAVAVIGPADSDGLFAMLRDDEHWDALNRNTVQQIESCYEEFLNADVSRRDILSIDNFADFFGIETLPTFEAEPAPDEFEHLYRLASGLLLRADFYSEVFHTAVMYSPRSTIDRSSIKLKGDDSFSNEVQNDGNFQFHDCGLKIVHMIGTDRDLAERLEAELRLRHAWPTVDYGRTLLISERDTLYGTYGVRPFLDLAENKDHLEVIRYLKINEESVDADDPANHLRSELISEFNSIKQAHRFRTRNAERILSIGVMGTSKERKIAILKLAREIFPAAVLFTTDLDAAMFSGHSDLQNTLVASHYGLSLNPELGLQVPAFNNSYQTSTFAACLAALRSEIVYNALPRTESRIDPWGRNIASTASLEPLVWEIGREYPYQFWPVEQPYAENRRAGHVSFQTTAPPRLSTRRDVQLWFLTTIAIIVLFLLFIAQLEEKVEKRIKLATSTVAKWFRKGTSGSALAAEREEPLADESISRVEWTTIGACVFAIVLFIVMVVSDQRSTGEPIGIGNGISIWPSLWVLAACGVTATVLVPWIRNAMCDQARAVDRCKERITPDPREIEPPADVDHVDAPIHSYSYAFKVRRGLTDYSNRLKAGNAGRVFVTSVLLSLIAFLLVWILRVDVSPPARGLLAIVTAWFVQAIVAVSLIVCVCKATFNVSQAREASVKWLKNVSQDLENSWKALQTGGDVGVPEQSEVAAESPTDQPPELMEDADRLPLWEDAVRKAKLGWELTDLAAHHSRVASRPVEAAALLVLVFGLARTQLFDGWASSTALLVLLLAILGICIIFAFYLRRDLQRVRTDLRGTIDKLQTAAEISENKEAAPYAAKLKSLSNAIAAIKQGAFQPTVTNPVLRATIYAIGSLLTVASQWLSTSLFR